MSSFLRDYLTVVWFGLAALVLGGLLLGVAAAIRPSKPNPSKLMPYESGSDPSASAGRRARSATTCSPCSSSSSTWKPSSSSRGPRPPSATADFGLVVMLAFMILLLDGLLYAWKRGLLRWV
jgi:NADH-quinone oxidoreductase subunit A